MLVLGLTIVVIFMIARMNKSNKLFWVLLVSMLAGFVGGSIAVRLAKSNTTENTIKKEVNNIPMQTPTCAIQVKSDIEAGEGTLVETKSAGLGIFDLNSGNTAYTTKSKVNVKRSLNFVFDTS